MRNAGLEETQAGIKIAGRNINNLRYADDTTLMLSGVPTAAGNALGVRLGRGEPGWRGAGFGSWRGWQLFPLGGQSIGASTSPTVLPMNIQD